MNKFSAIEERAAKGREFLDEIAAAMQAKAPDFAAPEPISAPEWSNARSTPDCIVKDYLFADVAVFNVLFRKERIEGQANSTQHLFNGT